MNASKTLRVLVIPVRGLVEVRFLPRGKGVLLKAMQEIVGGDIEVVAAGPQSSRLNFYVNEHGRRLKLDFNVRVSGWVEGSSSGYIDRHGPIVGDAFVCGPPDAEGNPTDAPASLIAYAQRIDAEFIAKFGEDRLMEGPAKPEVFDEVVSSKDVCHDVRKPCPGCPFARHVAIVPGQQVGGSSPFRYIGQAIGPFLLPCHQAAGFGPSGQACGDVDAPQCAGAAIYRSNVGVADKIPKTLLHLPADTELVFASPAELLMHHMSCSAGQAEAMLRVTSPETALRQETELAEVNAEIRRRTGFGEARISAIVEDED